MQALRLLYGLCLIPLSTRRPVHEQEQNFPPRRRCLRGDEPELGRHGAGRCDGGSPPPLPLIGAEQVMATQGGRAQLEQTLQRADVVAALQARGVSVDAARDRVAALTDAEAAQVAAQIDQAPAGGDVLGTIVFIFVVLLITDILGFTKIFPFTRSIR
jgi:hypothetical protein